LIERLNFYDIFGYLLPGSLLLGLLCLPRVLIQQKFPSASLVVSAAFLLSAYLLGFLIQGIASVVVPSEVSYQNKFPNRFPSDWLLEENQMSEALQTRITKIVHERWQIALRCGLSAADDEKTRIARNNAFALVRTAVRSERERSYGEQFQGLYTLMRGTSFSCGAGAIFLLGWALGILLQFRYWVYVIPVLEWIIGLALLTCICLTARQAFRFLKKKDAKMGNWILLGILLAALLCGSVLLSFYTLQNPSNVRLLLAVVGILFVASFRFHLAYKDFAILFAKTVWEDSATLPLVAENGPHKRI
jgi:hypothetical protein